MAVVLSREETGRLLEATAGRAGLMARMMYGSGLRLSELLRLRVKDVDLERLQVTVRGGKWDKDRMTPLAESLRNRLTDHLRELRAVYERDRAEKVSGHKDVATTQIYLHVMRKPGMEVRSPLDL